jgi:hypothetical protein
MSKKYVTKSKKLTPRKPRKAHVIGEIAPHHVETWSIPGVRAKPPEPLVVVAMHKTVWQEIKDFFDFT